MAKKPKEVRATKATKSVTATTRAAIPPTHDSGDLGKELIVRGTVSYSDKSPAVGLTVSAFDKDVGGEDRLGDAITDEKGGYRIVYNDAKFRRSPSESRGADVFVRVYGANGDLLFQSKTKINASADLELNVPLPAKTFVVRGQVRLGDGTPVADAQVRAYDKDLRKEEQLGEPATTDKDGRYEIAYSAGDFARAEQRSADLIVRATKPGWGEPTASSIIFNAKPDETVPLVVGGRVPGSSEYDRLIQTLTPLLQDVPLADLTDDDIAFLAGDTGEDPQRIAWLTQGAKLARQTNGSSAPRFSMTQAYRPAPTDRAIPPEIPYGWFRQGLPTELNALIAMDDRALRDALETSQRDNVIAELPAGALDRIMELVHVLRVANALRPAGDGDRTSLGDLLSVALPAAKHDVIASAWVVQGNGKDIRGEPANDGNRISLESMGGPRSFLETLEKDERLSADDVRQVRTTLALDDLTGGHLPLIRELSRMGQDSPTARGLSGLARLDHRDWVELLQHPRDPDDPASAPIGAAPGHDSVDSYARFLAGVIEEAFPTQVIANRIGRDTLPTSPFNEVRADLTTFFERNPEFSFGTTPLRSYLNDDIERKLGGVEDPARLRHELLRIERVTKFAPRFQPMRALLTDDVSSARDALLLGKREFTNRYARTFGGDALAEAAFNQANTIGFGTLSLYLQLGTIANAPMPWVLDPGGTGTVNVDSFSDVDRATWNGLFGSLDLCDCDDCQSVQGASAYFADLLMFVRHQGGTEGAMPLDLLLVRRPDLAQLELTCDNTNIKLPYVDLVNEVLANAVADPSTTIIGDFAAADFDQGVLVDDVKLALSLTGRATLVTEVPGKSWAIRDPGWRYAVSMNDARTGIVVRPFPQTAPTEADLAANPQHVNARAYAKLAQAGYPWALPLNLPVEQARVYLHQLGVERYQLMEALQTLWDAQSDDTIAAEYLGLSSVEAGIITGTITRDPSHPAVAGVADLPWTFWGFATEAVKVRDPAQPASRDVYIQGNWAEVLKRVPVFLSQSGLSYADLLALLDTYYLNPQAGGGRTLNIVSRDQGDPATCDVNKLEIQGLNAARLAKIHRFVRLRLALDWSARDLDRAVTALGATDLTPPFLRQLAQVRRLKVRLGVSIASLLAFRHDIDVATYMAAGANEKGAAGIPSLYAELFRNRAVVSPVDEAFTEDPAGLTGALADHAATVLGALQISAADFALLTTGPTTVVTGTALSLGNLSALHRHAALAHALKLSITELLQAKALLGGDPFVSLPEMVRFVARIDGIRATGLDVASLAFLLRNETAEARLQSALDAQSAGILAELRTGLAKIDEENARVADPLGDEMRKKLLQLRWDDIHIERAIALLGDAVRFNEPLAILPRGIAFPGALAERVSYDARTATLSFRGVMSDADRLALRGVTAAAGADLTLYFAAVEGIFTASRLSAKTFLADRMRAFELPVFSAPAGGQRLQQELTFPDKWKGRVQYDRSAGKVRAVGALTDADLVELLTLSTAADYQAAANSLVQQAKTFSPEAQNRFLILVSATDPVADPARTSFTDLFDSGKSGAERFDYALSRISAYLRQTASDSLVKQTLSDAFNLDAGAVHALLTTLLKAPSDPANKAAITDLVSPTWVHSTGDITPSYYPNQFAVLGRVRKVAMLVSRFRITASQLAWIARIPTAAGWLDWNDLPVESTAPAVPFPAWEKLVMGLGLRGTPFKADDAALALLSMANDAGTTKGTFLQALADAGTWDLADVRVLAGIEVAAGAPQEKGLLNLTFPNDFRDGEGVARVRTCFKLLRRLGANATQLAQWTRPDLADELPAATKWKRALANASAIKNAVKARYNDHDWLDIVKPLQDRLRSRQRDALVSYLVAGRQFGSDEFDLYDYFLIDVEMAPCMMTTRLKQAICSVQLFVQRSLMNLEPNVTLGQEDAKEWNTWRKLYRVWEANRKVFLYPENWIEPELRDDKSPFFKELENELLQNDVTADTAEDAVQHYLERLDQVARLEIVGMHLQRDTSDSSGARAVLHLFGRTYALPHVYFYRRLKGAVWSPWEKVDLDIEGDHLIPIVWNDHLYLSWPIFTDKTEQPTKTQRANNDDPAKYWEIKLAWSEYKHDKWLPKKLSREYLKYVKDPASNVPQERGDFKFLAQVQTGAFGSRLVVHCYGTAVSRTVTPPSQPPPPVPRPDVLLLAAGDWQVATIKFTVKGAQPEDADLKNITIALRNHADNSYLVDAHPVRLFPSGTGIILPRDKATDYYFVAGAFSAATVTEGPAVLNLRYVDVDLNRFHEASPVSNTPAEPIVTVTPTLMQAIGRFQFDDCRADVHVFPVNAAVPPIQPTGLVPLAGTQFVDMAMVEHLNWSDTFVPKGVLKRTPGTFRVLTPADSYAPNNALMPFVFQDDSATFLVDAVALSVAGQTQYKARFQTLYHPWICRFMATLNSRGLAQLLTLDTQSLLDDPNRFTGSYVPNPLYVDLNTNGDRIRRTPREDVDFSPEGAYSLYNWELFFHTPLLIATKLSKNQRFEEARTWFHCIFDPTASLPGGRERFWRLRPFFEEATNAPPSLADFLKAESEALAQQTDAWQQHPFQPFVIARLRVLAFMKTVVMKYVQNLIDWADHLFTRDTIEAINEATQLYVLAARILGKRQGSIPARAKPTVQTFDTVAGKEPNAFFIALVDIESYVFPASAPATSPSEDGTGSLNTMPLFCIPKNDKLLGYWDTVADRLFKIRHCMNMAGVVRELPIFDPPIDPALLVRAAAAGVDLDSVLNDLYAPMPQYRYGVMERRASDLCNDVKTLGAALLSALEKKDAEKLALLRSGHEIEMLNAVRQVREQQVDEARSMLDGLMEYQKVVTARQQYYLGRPFMNSFETAHAQIVASSLLAMAIQIGAETIAGVLHLIPESKVGAFTTIGVTYGGSNIAAGVQAFGSAAGSTASTLNTIGSLSATMGGYSRRQDDWTHQADLATKELEQVQKQIAAAEIRLAIAANERTNHEMQIAHVKEVDEYMREKYTNAELYDWMVGQLSAIYFQSYRLAYDVAKRAERCYRFELGLADSNFIQFGYWDSLKKGLLAGERLQLDLRRMELDYAERNKREYEITKHVSMLSLDPAALITLRETYQCEISIPEASFNMDCPGHYLRRIKSVSVTIPCVTGPNVGVNCTLTLLKSAVRRSTSDAGLTETLGAIQSVVTSSGQNDTGLFETNMNDERYLPFEGAGAIGTWRLDLPSAFMPFDYSTISDVILHLRYTARNGGDAFKGQVLADLQTAVNQVVSSSGRNGLARLVSLRHEFPTEWYRFVREPVATDSRVTIGLGSDRFPYLFSGRTINVGGIEVLIKVKPEFAGTHNDESLKIGIARGAVAPSSADDNPDVLPLAPLNGLLHADKAITPTAAITSSTGTQWTMNAWLDDGAGPAPLDPTALEDVVLLIHYTV